MDQNPPLLVESTRESGVIRFCSRCSGRLRTSQTRASGIWRSIVRLLYEVLKVRINICNVGLSGAKRGPAQEENSEKYTAEADYRHRTSATGWRPRGIFFSFHGG